MNGSISKWLKWCSIAALVPPIAAAQPNLAAPDTTPEVVDLGEGRYRIGEVLVDTQDRSFTVPGSVLHLEDALEYLAVTVGGSKGYESLLELDADAYQFNLACILIGLSSDEAVLPDHQFDTEPVVGPRVRITARWIDNEREIEVPAADLLSDRSDLEREIADEWVYTGSFHGEVPGALESYMANISGALIGFVHDPTSVIEHRLGVGIGRYGSIVGNRELLTEVGMELDLSISIVESAAID